MIVRVLQYLGAVVLLALGMVAPQYVYFISGASTVLAVIVAVVIAALFAGLMWIVGRSLKSGLIATAIGLALIIFTPVIGAADFQMAFKLQQGRTLDDVTLAKVISDGEEDMWVRINDGRVRSEVSERVTFVSGTSRPGQPAQQTRTHYDLAPVTHAAEVSNENPVLRSKPTGSIALWACATSSGGLRDWDTERQAVRGRLARIEGKVLASLNEKLTPMIAMPNPGFGSIPAAPGAAAPSRPVEGPTLRAANGAWCVHLDPQLDAASAKAKAIETLLVFVVMLPFMGAGVAFFIARI